MPSGPGFLLTFLYYFSCTTLIVVFVTSQGLGIDLFSRLPYQLGSSLGLVAGLLAVYFNRSVSVAATFPERKTWLVSLNQALDELGFEEQGRIDNFTVYGKSSLRNLFSGKILVRVEGNGATIIGRSSSIRRLKQLANLP